MPKSYHLELFPAGSWADDGFKTRRKGFFVTFSALDKCEFNLFVLQTVNHRQINQFNLFELQTVNILQKAKVSEFSRSV